MTTNNILQEAINTISSSNKEILSFDDFCIANNIKNEPLARSIKCNESTISRARKGLPIRPKIRKKILKFLPTLDPNLVIEWDPVKHHPGNTKSKVIREQLESHESIINSMQKTINDMQLQIDKLKEEIELLS